MNFEEIVQRAINAKAKASLRSIIMVQNLDIRCPQNYHSSNNIALKMQTQKTTAKNFSHPKKSKIKNLKSVFSCDNIAKPAKKKDKQKRFKY